VCLLRAFHGGSESRRLQKQVHKAPLVIDRKANRLDFFRISFDGPERSGRDPGFDTFGAICLLRLAL